MTFNLSEKMYFCEHIFEFGDCGATMNKGEANGDESYFKEGDIAEFIKQIKEKIKHYRTATYNQKLLHELDRFIDRLAGSKFK